MNVDLPIGLQTNQANFGGENSSMKPVTRNRSNSQSHVVSLPKVSINYPNRKRNQVQYYVTLLPLNDTFTKKHLPIAIYPETTKLGRPTGTRHKPDVNNGYFDSRVLSRNHAQMYIDGLSGKLMLQDLGSSNGTYLNDQRLGNDAVEIKIGDIVCLGFNVQTESTHKQISLKIDNINIIKNSQLLSDSPEFKHLNFIEDIYKMISKNSQSSLNLSLEDNPHLSFDSALFGDINTNIEDDLLTSYSQTNAGIYNNSQITNTSTFESIINILIANLQKIKQQNNNLHSLENFLVHYQTNLNDINNKYLESELSKHLQKIQTDLDHEKRLKVQATEKYESLEKQHQREIDNLKAKIDNLQQENLMMNHKFLDLQPPQIQREPASKSINEFPLNQDNFNKFDAIVLDNILDSPISESDNSNNDGENVFQGKNFEHNNNINDVNINLELHVINSKPQTSSNDRDADENRFNNDTNKAKLNGIMNTGDTSTDKSIVYNSTNESKSIDTKPRETSPTKFDSKKIADIDINELFLGLSTTDDITNGEDNFSSSKISELQLLDTEASSDIDYHEDISNLEKEKYSSVSPTKQTNVHADEKIYQEIKERFQENLHDKIKLSQNAIHLNDRETEHQKFPTKSDDRFNANEQVLQRVVIVVGAMFIGYLVKKISG